MYSRNEMRLLISVLVIALSAANSGDAWMCAAYCVSSPSAGIAASHHHQMGSETNAITTNGHQFSLFCSEYIVSNAFRAPSMKCTTGRPLNPG